MTPTAEALREAAQALLDEYNATHAAGGEMDYPHEAAKILELR